MQRKGERSPTLWKTDVIHRSTSVSVAICGIRRGNNHSPEFQKPRDGNEPGEIVGNCGNVQNERNPIPENKIKEARGLLCVWRRESNPQYAGSDEERASLPCCDHQPMFQRQKYTFFNIPTLFDNFFFRTRKTVAVNSRPQTFPSLSKTSRFLQNI